MRTDSACVEGMLRMGKRVARLPRDGPLCPAGLPAESGVLANSVWQSDVRVSQCWTG